MLFTAEQPEEAFLEIIEHVKNHGKYKKGSRTAEGTNSIFGASVTFDLEGGEKFPLPHTKKLFTRGMLHEILWIIRGKTNIADLKAENVKIWDEWADENGDLGPVYGKQMRDFGDWGVDQLNDTIHKIKISPNSRRHVITLWNPEDLPDESISPQENVAKGKQALSCCHGTYIQFYVDGDELSMMTHQRSCDTALGGWFNLASYSTFLMIVAKLCGKTARRITYTFGDTHIYENQHDAVNEQLKRWHEFEGELPQPKLIIHGDQKCIEDFKFEDFEIVDYDPMPAIKFPRPAI